MASCVAVPLYPPTRIQRLEEHVRRQARIMANAQASVLVTFRVFSQRATSGIRLPSI
jgi:hypothetical protein